MQPVAVVLRLARVRAHIDAELRSVFQDFGLTSPAFSALVTLARIADERGVSQRRLADELGLTAGTISVRIDRLVDKGLVERRPDPASQRNTLVRLTRKGRQLFERATPTHLANERRLLSALSDEEQALLVDLLRKLLIDFEASQPTFAGGGLFGLTLSPAHETVDSVSKTGVPHIPGLLVHSVDANSPAARADVRAGDVLVRAGRRQLRSNSAFNAAVRDADGDQLRLTVLRDGNEVHLSIDLGQGDSDRRSYGTLRRTAGRRQ